MRWREAPVKQEGCFLKHSEQQDDKFLAYTGRPYDPRNLWPRPPRTSAAWFLSTTPPAAPRVSFENTVGSLALAGRK